MAIKLLFDKGGIDGLVCPVITCDICSGLIRNDAQAGVVYNFDPTFTKDHPRNESISSIMFICDVSFQSKCWHEFERRYGHAYWQSLNALMCQLVFNTMPGLRPTLKQAKENKLGAFDEPRLKQLAQLVDKVQLKIKELQDMAGKEI